MADKPASITPPKVVTPTKGSAFTPRRREHKPAPTRAAARQMKRWVQDRKGVLGVDRLSPEDRSAIGYMTWAMTKESGR